MRTECSEARLEFQGLGRRRVEAGFDGGALSSDAGALLLRETDRATNILKRFAACFTDRRDPDLIEHTVEELVSQRVYGLALGYEDLNDHEQLRRDPLLATLVGKADPTGGSRVRERDKGAALAGKSTLNRLEHIAAAKAKAARYHKITYDARAIDNLLVDLFIESQREAPQVIVLDFDPTDLALHGTQEGRFYHGYYRKYCYLPLYGFAEQHLLCARLRPANIDASAGTLAELEPLVARLRAAFPAVRILLRGDSAFAREELMSWCEQRQVDYLFGMAKNVRLSAAIARQAEKARRRYLRTGKSARVFRDFHYRTLASWSRARRVVGKAEHLAGGANPRFVVTSLSHKDANTRELYEELYCARGEAENRIKEQFELFADRVSSHTQQANQLRLYFSAFAYVLLDTLRRLALAGTELAHAHCGTIRLKLLKLGAQVRVSARRIYCSLSSAFPLQPLFAQALRKLQAYRPPLRA